jgi:23S rRNA G2069 N7-methylase RlmK/C1962 C5-methylase RlmI
MDLLALERLLTERDLEAPEAHQSLVPEILTVLGLERENQYLDASVFDQLMTREVFQQRDESTRKSLFNITASLSRLWLCQEHYGLKLWYKIHLDGGGISMAAPMLKYLRRRFPGRKFFKMLDWCAGPGFIGLIAQKEGLAEYLALLDISQAAAECAARNIEANGLRKTRFYLSNNFAQLPSGEKFDLIIGNPPWTYQQSNYLNPRLSSDPGWKLHASFYEQVRPFLYPGGLVCLTCYEPYQTEVFLGEKQSTLYDRRPRPAAETFQEMIQKAGLQFLEIAQPPELKRAHMGQGLHLILSQNQE